MTIPVTIRLQAEDFDVAAESAKLARGRTDIGAVVSFVGICRGGEGADAIEALTLEHYPGMANEEIARHVEQPPTRCPLLCAPATHPHPPTPIPPPTPPRLT